MIDIERVIKEVALELDLDRELVDAVCKHAFKYTVEVMKSDDTADIMFNKLFKFKLKRRYKENKNAKYTSK